MTIRHLLCAAMLLACSLLAPPRDARAAEGYDNCAGTISTLPTTITTQGVWCMKKDLATSISSGHAITIAANNVTIDCNDFKIGGLAAGPTSGATGIFASARQNTTIRHCNIRGFHVGIELDDGAGNLVEDNRLDNNLFAGIWIQSSDHNRVRRNAVYDTGGLTDTSYAYGIYAAADISDNTVDGVFTDAPTRIVYGIYEPAAGAQITGNRVGGIAITAGDANALAFGIAAFSGALNTIADNHVVAAAANTPGWGIKGSETPNASICIGNTVANFPSSLYCMYGATNGNLHH